jgi:hypothetical protein
MKKIVYSLLALALLSTTACKKDFLNKTPLDKYSDEAVWKDPSLVQTFVNNIYLGIPHGFSNIMMSAMVDETTYNADFGSSNVTLSRITPSDYSIFDEGFWTANRQRGMNWSIVYKFIRSANLFFEKIDGVSFAEAAQKDRLKGEVHFLRAYLYYNLVSMYGGVPLIDKTYTLKDEFTIARSSFDDCIKFITADLDKAAGFLPLRFTGSGALGSSNIGRATKGAALALKSRVLLYAASDLFNTNGAWAGGFANKALIGYTGGDRMARWQAAKDAAKAVIDLGVYSLHKPNPATAAEAASNYADIFLQKQTSEDIFIRFFTPRIDENWDGYNPGLYNTPNGWHGWGSNTPIGQHVDAYEMSNGTKFNWSDPVHRAAPYQNRDPRFYASINYDGAKWRPRPADAVGATPIGDGVGIVQTGYYERPNGSVIAGLDTRNSPIEDWNGTYTGYFMRKFLDPAVDPLQVKQDAPWRYIRYAEILLNFAEAAHALGQDGEARQMLNMIRKRAGMPDITESGANLLERLRNERRIELAFEDLRFFDVRRWMIASEAYQDATGVDIRHRVDAANNITSSTYTSKVAQTRAWNPRFYFLPIKLDEMNRNNKLVQNPLY